LSQRKQKKKTTRRDNINNIFIDGEDFIPAHFFTPGKDGQLLPQRVPERDRRRDGRFDASTGMDSTSGHTKPHP